MLFPYQLSGSEFLASRYAAMVADPPGLGKTAQAIAAADKVDAKRVLVICPASLKVNWAREFDKFSQGWDTFIVQSGKTRLIEPRSDAKLVTILNYDLAHSPAILKQLLFSQRFDVLIIDEAHYLKTPTALRTRAVYGEGCDGVNGIVQNCDRVWLLTGTPTPNGEPVEIWSHLSGTNQTSMSHDKFKWTYGTYRETKYGYKFLKPKNVDDLKHDIDSFMIRRKKADVLKDMPPLVLADLVVESTARADMADLRNHPELESLKALSGHDVDDEVLEQISQAELATLRRLTGILKVKPTAQLVRERLENGVDKIVLFTWHKEVMALLKAELSEYAPVTIAGETTMTARQDAVDQFQNAPMCRVFIGQIAAAGTGITLTAASQMIIVEPSFVPADNEQASLRIHRIGQTEPCLVQFAALADSVDEVVTSILRRKTEALVQIYDN